MTDAEEPVEPPAHLAHLKGMDLVRRTLEEARGAAREQGKNVGRGRTAPAPRRTGASSRRPCTRSTCALSWATVPSKDVPADDVPAAPRAAGSVPVGTWPTVSCTCCAVSCTIALIPTL